MSEPTSKILQRLRKLLSLAGSSEPHEAAAAMRQAQKLMQTYSLSLDDVDILQVEEHDANFVSKTMPPAYLLQLADVVELAFGARLILTGRQGAVRFTFVGVGAQAQIASYVFDVLRRTLTRHRQDYLSSLGKRLKRSTKTRRADLFCRAWLIRIELTVSEFIMPTRDQELLSRYWDARLGKTEKYVARQRETTKRDSGAAEAGFTAADGVTLNHAVSGSAGQQRLGVTS